MKQCPVLTAHGVSFRRCSGRLVPLVLVAMALSVVAACSQSPAPAPPPVVQVAVQPTIRPTAEAVPTPVPTPTRTATPAIVPAATAVPSPASPPPAFPVDPATVAPPGARLHDLQEIRVPDGHGGGPPWRDRGVQRIFSPWVYGTIYQIDRSGAVRPYIGVGHDVNEDMTVWTIRLREDAVFQDGTPITAADVKAYWEHGAKPINILIIVYYTALSLYDIKGWEDLRAGDATEAEGLVVIDDHTLEITTAVPFPTWPLSMAAWNTGISKLDQVLSDELWFTYPIGAGPYKWTTDPDTKQFVAQADVAEFWGPSPSIKTLRGLNVTDDKVKLIMFENGELDLMTIDSATYEAALDPSHPFNPLLRVTPYGGLWYIKNRIDMAPLEDLQVRRALAHGADMRSIVRAVWGPAEEFATGLISPFIPCHDPDAEGHVYDPDLARQELASSAYGSAEDLPPLLIDLARPLMVDMGVALKEYWKDNLGVELDVLKREHSKPRREGSQFRRLSIGSWIPDPIQIVNNLTKITGNDPPWEMELLSDIPGGYPVLDALLEHARSLPLDDPERCAAFQAVEEEYMDKVHMMPIRWVGGVKWVVQPWVVGFESTSNLDINTLPWMYVLQH